MEAVEEQQHLDSQTETSTSSGISTTEEDDSPYYQELNRLFGLYRLANLNARYYGHRAEKYEARIRWTLIGAGALSAVALTVLLSVPASSTYARIGAIFTAGIAAVVTSIAPSFGWTEKAKELNTLHFSYSQLFGQLEFVITEIRRAGGLTSEHVGMARMVHEAFMRIETMDELDPDEKLVEEERQKVDSAFPANYLWTNF